MKTVEAFNIIENLCSSTFHQKSLGDPGLRDSEIIAKIVFSSFIYLSTASIQICKNANILKTQIFYQMNNDLKRSLKVIFLFKYTFF